MGRVLRATNPDADVRFERDALGRVLAETINGLTVRSSYDPLGRRTGVRTPSGRENAWMFDGNDRAVELRTAGQTMTVGLDPAGRELHRTFGATTLTQSWDALHRLASQSVTRAVAGRQPEVAQHRSYRYRADGRVAAIDDQLTGSRSFDMDLLGRVTAVRGPNWREEYSYNEAGNVADARWPGRDSDLHGPRDYGGSAVTTVGNVRYVRDRQGRVVLRQHKRLSAKPATWRFTWTNNDRMSGATTPDGTRYRYRYDAFGRRVAKERLAADGAVAHEVRFCWDGVQLVEQIQSDGRATGWDWDPGTSRPLAQIERVRGADQAWIDAAFYAIVTDLVGAPTELFDSTGALVWRRAATLWGHVLTPPGPVSTPLRFPGQYYDAETGLHYNHQRYYDPVAAQYYSADPAGAAAGENPYGYVRDPRRSIDRLGLAPCHLQDIKDYRERYQVGQGKNIAFADYDIDGVQGRSGMAPSGGHEYPNAAPVPANSPFHTSKPLDSEPKVLNQLINRLGLTPESSGEIHFHSERPACTDCQGVIAQFKEMFPNIEIKYTDYGGAGPNHPIPAGRTVNY
jgi:RHS repeat-associated protein